MERENEMKFEDLSILKRELVRIELKSTTLIEIRGSRVWRQDGIMYCNFEEESRPRTTVGKINVAKRMA